MRVARSAWPCVVLVLFLAPATSANANSLFFSDVVALQDTGFRIVDLFSNPGVTLECEEFPRFTSCALSFLVEIRGDSTGGFTDTLLIKSILPDLSLTRIFLLPPRKYPKPPFGRELFFTTFRYPGECCFEPTPVTLLVDILGSAPDFVNPANGEKMDSFTFSFQVHQPVPEPTSFLLLSTGLASLWGRRRRKGSKKT